MEQTTHLTRGGWRPEETEMLWQEIRAAAETGAPLRGVFERMGQTLGRKPNSVRNYYYMQLRDRAGDEFRRATPFATFSDEEIHQLLRRILMARGQGQSVRACVMELAGGDRALMLRYQNKYRSLLRKKPALLQRVCQELRAEGLPCPGEEAAVSLRPRQPIPEYEWSQDPDVRAILSALSALAGRAQAAAGSAAPAAGGFANRRQGHDQRLQGFPGRACGGQAGPAADFLRRAGRPRAGFGKSLRLKMKKL